MASATFLGSSELPNIERPKLTNSLQATAKVEDMSRNILDEMTNSRLMEEATVLVAQNRQALIVLQNFEESDYELDESSEDLEALLQLKLSLIRVEDSLFDMPRRKSNDLQKRQLAEAIAPLLYPAPSGSIGPIIRYEKDRVRIRKWIHLRRKLHQTIQSIRGERVRLAKRLEIQGPWNPETQPISLLGPPSLPMPVKVADEASLAPFFRHLYSDGSSELTSLVAAFPAKQMEEPFYNVKALEFPKGVLYEDGRMDLCKMVVGPPYIGPLIESLRSNTFVKHFLLGNNIIGPTGAKHIAQFVKEYPERIDTWYLAGNVIDGTSFINLVDAFVTSPTITNIWLKRNPLGPKTANDIFRLITRTPNLRTLDLDQTALGDKAVAELFKLMLQHQKRVPLRNIYLNGNGIGVIGATAIGKYLASNLCSITSIYMGLNPLGSKGVAALASGLKDNTSLERLFLPSTGMSDSGAIILFSSLYDHINIKVLDIGLNTSFADLGQANNYISNAVAPCLAVLIDSALKLEYLNIGYSALTKDGLNTVLASAIESRSILYLHAVSIYPLGRDISSVKAGQVHAHLSELLRQRTAQNVNAKHGDSMDYHTWFAKEKRWVISDETDVRKIDSVYRNRDMDKARRGLMKLDKWWKEDDDTLAMVAEYQE